MGAWKQGTHLRGERPWPADDSHTYTYDIKTMYIYIYIKGYRKIYFLQEHITSCPNAWIISSQCASLLGAWKQGAHIRGERPWPADDSHAYNDINTMYVYNNVYAYDFGGKTVSEEKV